MKIMSQASSISGVVRSPLLLGAVGTYLTSDSGTNVFALARTGWAMQTASATDSVALAADAWHLRVDVYTSMAVLVGLVAGIFTAGIVVGAYLGASWRSGGAAGRCPAGQRPAGTAASCRAARCTA